jgi:hypothetical protein
VVSLIIASKLLINFRMKIQDENLRLHDFSRRVYFAFQNQKIFLVWLYGTFATEHVESPNLRFVSRGFAVLNFVTD